MPKARRLLPATLMAAAAVLAGCTPAEPAAPAPTPTPVPSEPAATPSPEPTLPAVAGFRVAAGESAPPVKRAAVQFLRTLLNHEDGGGTVAATRARLASARLPTGPADQAGPLLNPAGAQTGEVIYPQLCGLTEAISCVIAAVRTHQLDDGGEVVSVSRTIDLRLGRKGAAWQVTSIGFNGGRPPTAGSDRAAASTLARDVLANPRITMPDSARHEVRSGAVDARVLRLLLDLGRRWPVSVSVFKAGHPNNVFGTDRVSNHTRGRAVDLWAVGGQAVAAQRGNPASPARALMIQGLRAGAPEVGGPWVVSAGGRTSYTNTTHLDHIHLGFD
jgi:hypothetical protein